MSIYHVDFHPKILNDYSEAHYWYELRQPGLGDDFIDIITRKIEQIRLNPNLYSEKDKRGYREAVVEKYPFVIVYKLLSKNKVIFVTAIHHNSKSPKEKYRK